MSSDENWNGEYRVERTENILGGGPTETRTVRTVTQGEPVVTRIIRTTSHGTEEILGSDGSSTSRIIQGEPTFITRTIRTTSGGESGSEAHNFQTINEGDSSRDFQTTTQSEPTFMTRTIRTTSGGESGSEIHNFRSIDEGDSSRDFQTTTQGEPTFTTHTTRTTSYGTPSIQSGFSTPSADARFQRVEQVFASNPTFQVPTFGATTEGGLSGETGGESEGLNAGNTVSAVATGSGSGNEIHYGRDKAIGAGVVGSGGDAGVEHERSFGSQTRDATDTGVIGGTGSSGSAVLEGGNTIATGAESEKDHQYGRDTALGVDAGAGAGGATFAEQEKVSNSNDQGSSDGAATGGILGGLGALIGGIGTTLGLTSENPATGEEKDKSSKQAENTSTSAITGSGSEKDQNHGRDASVAAGGISAAGIAEHEQTSDTKAGNAKTFTNSSRDALSNQDQQRSATATTTSDSEKDHNHGHDAALASGTAAASGALAHLEHELSPQGRNPNNTKFDSDLYERPEIAHSRSSTSISDPSDLKRIQTTKSMRERRALFEPIASGDRAELKRIASNWEGESMVRSSTRGSGLERRDTLAGVNIGDSVLDPKSEDFDPYKWSRMMMRLIDENEVIQRRAGIVWKNLKICGSGSAINLQKNVGSLFLAPLRFGEFFGRGPEKTILKEFEGVLKTGEMLVVLGRPGSGCSTLLKSLMGELTGLDMKEQSEVHYNGMSFFPRFLCPRKGWPRSIGPGGLAECHS
jgi:hypothetical protein